MIYWEGKPSFFYDKNCFKNQKIPQKNFGQIFYPLSFHEETKKYVEIMGKGSWRKIRKG